MSMVVEGEGAETFSEDDAHGRRVIFVDYSRGYTRRLNYEPRASTGVGFY